MHLLDYCNPLQLALLLTWCGRNTDIVTSSHDSSWFPWCSSALLLLQPRAAATFISKTTVSATLVIQTTTRATVVIRMLWHHPRPLMLRPALQLLLQPRAAAALHLQDYTSLFKLLHLKDIMMRMLSSFSPWKTKLHPSWVVPLSCWSDIITHWSSCISWIEGNDLGHWLLDDYMSASYPSWVMIYAMVFMRTI